MPIPAVKRLSKLHNAAKKREEIKNDKYNSEILLEGNASKCIPAMFEHFGTWGVAADRLLNTLSLKSTDGVR